ncbi:ATP-binding cassette domain-containing protein [Oceanimonas pelagia]|uniref:ATP-binding cassette domain-containing protein n=1 Tax=Oceanimonas pelagia TaxID=3028314 RepID=A0AA50KNM7_9GAMM|nr:ATP-binding cassette domain-containing protein [Oceanimonas pelagia]WMC10416.1 ATP-binding cassette domain-containing protein [Oceanimonas pelagia]
MTELLKAQQLAVPGIVRPLSFTLTAGRPLTLLGETGSGKSLIAQAIMGNLPAALRVEGRLWLRGEELSGRPAAERRKLWGRRLTMLPQEPWLALDPTMKAVDQVAEGYRYLADRDWPEARRLAKEDLTRLGLDHALDRLPGQLSGGMMQRLAFAAASTGGADIVIADEPTKGLDAGSRDQVTGLLRQVAEAGGGLLTITHDIAVARQLGGEVMIVRNGEVLESGPAKEVLKAPVSDYGRALLAAEPDAWPALAPAGAGERVLKVEGLAKSRGGRRLFSDVSFELNAGEIMGVVGPSGCGKSTLGSICLGLLEPDAGTVWRDASLPRTRYQKLYQDPPAAFAPECRLGQGLQDLVKLHRKDWAEVERLLPRQGLSLNLLDRLPREVSGGELQRLAILRILLLEPVLLFADEPTSRLDLVTQQHTIKLLTDLARERGCALLLVSHEAALVNKVADRVLTLG